MRQESSPRRPALASVFPDGRIAFPALYGGTGRCVLRRGKIGIDAQDAIRQIAGALKQGLVLDEVCKLQPARPRLAIPKKVTWASQLQIAFGEAEAVVGVAQCLKSRLGFGRQLAEGEQARALLTRSANPASELVQLRQPEPLGLLDDHDVCRRDVDAHFQHGGSYQHLELAFDKCTHQCTAFFTGESAVDLAYAVVSKLRLHLGAGLVDTNQVI